MEQAGGGETVKINLCTCGSSNIGFVNEFYSGFFHMYFFCRTCGESGKTICYKNPGDYEKTKQQAIAAWNRRAEPETITAPHGDGIL
jgi:hypothetical protein